MLLLGLAACDASDIPSQPSEPPAPPMQAPEAAAIIIGTNTWAARPDMSVRRFGLATAAVGSVLYAIGGMSEYGYPYSLVEAYETKAGALGAWVPRTVLPNMLAHFNGAAVINGKIYVPGGRDAMGTPAASLFVYTPGTNSWSSKKPMPKPGFGGGAVAIAGKLYVVTNPGDGTRSVLFRYTPATDQWAVLAQPYKNLKGAVLGVINGKLYAAGGASQVGSVTGRTDAYDPSTNTWTRRKDMPVPRTQAGAAVANGLLYVIGGLSSAGIHRTTSMYIP